MECLTWRIRDKTFCKLEKPVKEVGESLSDTIVCFRFSLNSSEHHPHDCTLFIFI